MEDALALFSVSIISAQKRCVLILVLMEDALAPKMLPLVTMATHSS